MCDCPRLETLRPCTQAVAKRFLVFEEARELVWEKRLTSQADWTRWCKEGNRPPNVPSRPQQVTYSDVHYS
jgi:hypothetical protein